MKNFIFTVFLFSLNLGNAQKLDFQTLLKDRISIRALQIYNEKVWYSGTDAKFGYVSLKDSVDKKQLVLSDKKLQFRTLAQSSKEFSMIDIDSLPHQFTINKRTLEIHSRLVPVQHENKYFFDAFKFDKGDRGFAISDPNKMGSPIFLLYTGREYMVNKKLVLPKYFTGEAHFAASNSNIAMTGGWVWIATGGSKARIFKFNWKNPTIWEVYNTPFIQGTSSQGIYSIDFYDKKFGIAVGGDYTNQSANIDNIATTNDGGVTWQIQASGKNGGYKTCVKIRPKSKGKDIIAVGDQNIEFSSDYGKTWKTISEEKGLFVCEWIDQNTLVFAGKDRIVKAKLTNSY
ncbi:WD40/YVTN/BNR-like repeat-containing protein [Chryseobacterium sp. R2A-55]|uniref:WD40/YVTN/BNR-like repeat-containing protein n=1 Tax=Chryseobacterium sp. R2A-55 TaxID=2744445 RepID=UPI001F23BEFD|nr:glycosyl hydrolase [Chryseobacterium sp. R2A-55]